MSKCENSTHAACHLKWRSRPPRTCRAQSGVWGPRSPPVVQYSTVQYSTVQYSTVQYSKVHCCHIILQQPRNYSSRISLSDSLHGHKNGLYVGITSWYKSSLVHGSWQHLTVVTVVATINQNKVVPDLGPGSILGLVSGQSATRARNEPSQSFHNHGKGPYWPSPGWKCLPKTLC